MSCTERRLKKVQLKRKSYWSCELSVETSCCTTVPKFPCCSWSLLWRWDVLGGRLAGLPWLRCYGQAWGAAHQLRFLERVLAVLADVGGSRDGKAPGLSWCLDCVGMQLWSGRWLLHFWDPCPVKEGCWCPTLGWLMDSVFESRCICRTACRKHSDCFLSEITYLALGVACFCGWHRRSSIYTVWCFPGLRLSLFSNL